MNATRGLNVSGVDARHAGLPCRGAAHCDHIFRVPDHATLPELLLAGRGRDAHELSAHGYVHVAVPLPYSYQSTVSKRGRSLLGRHA